DGLYGFIDRHGQQIIPAIYEDAGMFSDGLAPVMVDGRWGFIDRDGRVIIPPELDLVQSFKNGLALIEQEGRFAYINKIGKQVCIEDRAKSSLFYFS
ncbi:MAG: WG repeat-containing protein, partial [Phaeodactylibacter sp.]|nr:WG repeat-containing protein [Phaeodactylibacter sp.]